MPKPFPGEVVYSYLLTELLFQTQAIPTTIARMLLQPTSSNLPLHSHNHSNHSSSLSSNFSYSISFSRGFSNSATFKPISIHKNPVFTCSISQVYSYGTMDYERRPILKWVTVYKKISFTKDPNMGSGSVLNQWEKDNNRLSKWELCRIVKELRKFGRYKFALEVYEWMNNREERFILTTSDSAIQLDLIAKVRGIKKAEEYFFKLPDSLKDNRIYGALLNGYARARMKQKAESVMEKMRVRGYARHSLPYNVMMTLYMNLKQFDKVESIVSEMKEKHILMDIYSYNIRLSSCGACGSVEKMEQVLEEMKLDTAITPNWTTYSTMATQYIRLRLAEKAEECLKKVEARITGRDRIPYHYLINLYGSIGKKEEVFRVWNIYKSIFFRVSNLGYLALISSLIRQDDIEDAEMFYKEWLSVKSAYDPRIGNLLLGWYVRKGFSEKAMSFFDNMIEYGGNPNSVTWEIIAEVHVIERRISKALSCLKDAVLADRSKSWRPSPGLVTSILKFCEKEGDVVNKEALMEVLRQVDCFDDETYMCKIPILNGSYSGGEPSTEDDDDDANMLLNELQGSL